MTEDRPAYKKSWILTGPALQKLLACLDRDTDEAGRKLLDLRKRLYKFFECNRCTDAEYLVDVTIDRTARRIDEGVGVRDLPSYASQVARFVLKEQWSSPERSAEEIDAEGSKLKLISTETTREDDSADMEQRLECLERCSEALVPAERQRVIDYYYDEGRAKIDKRKQMAADLRITAGNLRVRMHRVRERLEECILKCMIEKKRI